jgi:hypothetical protein
MKIQIKKGKDFDELVEDFGKLFDDCATLLQYLESQGNRYDGMIDARHTIERVQKRWCFTRIIKKGLV